MHGRTLQGWTGPMQHKVSRDNAASPGTGVKQPGSGSGGAFGQDRMRWVEPVQVGIH